MILTRANKKGPLWTKNYRKSVLGLRANQKALSPMKVLRRRANQKAFTKVSTKTKKKYAIDETEYEEPLVTDNPVINEPIYFNLFE